MRFLATLFATLLLVGSASAVELICTVPPAGVPRGVELCETVRIQNRVPLSRWDNDACATELLRRGMRGTEAAVTKGAIRDAERSAVRDALTDFDANHPKALVPARCGDDELTPEFNETCDDGNTDPGDGCDGDCQLE
jgi:cysteine-rich repeat protein